MIPTTRVVVICADWCGVCRAFKTVVRDSQDFRVTWIELDDFEELSGNTEIDTFPTVIIVRDTAVLFIGAIKPNIESLKGLMNAVSHNGAPVPEYEELGRDLRSLFD